MRKTTLANDTTDSFLSRHLGQYSDEAEKSFMTINPGIENHGLYLPANTTLELPEVSIVSSVKRRTVWD
jgi:phage tail protein X